MPLDEQRRDFEFEGDEEKPPSWAYRLFCKCGCLCMVMYFVVLPVILLGIAAIVLVAFFNGKSDAVPPMLPVPSVGGPGLPAFTAQLRMANLSTLIAELEDVESDVSVAVREYLSFVAGNNTLETVSASEAAAKRRRLSARRLAEAGYNGELAFAYDGDDATYSAYSNEIFALGSSSKSVKSGLADALEVAMDRVNLNVSVAVGTVKPSYRETVMGCNLTRPFVANARTCGGLINVLITRPELEGLAFSPIPGCVIDPDYATLAYDGRTESLFFRLACPALTSPPASLGCIAIRALKDIAATINAQLEANGLGGYCTIKADETSCFHYDEGSAVACKTCSESGVCVEL